MKSGLQWPEPVAEGIDKAQCPQLHLCHTDVNLQKACVSWKDLLGEFNNIAVIEDFNCVRKGRKLLCAVLHLVAERIDKAPCPQLKFRHTGVDLRETCTSWTNILEDFKGIAAIENLNPFKAAA